MIFGLMCITICQSAISLGHSIDRQSGHVDSTAKVAGSRLENSVRNASGCCGKYSSTSPAGHRLKVVFEEGGGGVCARCKEANYED